MILIFGAVTAVIPETLLFLNEPEACLFQYMLAAYIPGYRIGKYGLKPQIIKSIAQGQDLSLCTVASVLNTVILKVDAECALAGFPVGGVRLPLVDATPEQLARQMFAYMPATLRKAYGQSS